MAPHSTTTLQSSSGVTDTPDSDRFDFTHLTPFPDDITTAPLLRLSLHKLRGEPEESQRLFSASKDLGFFYLDLGGDGEGDALLDEAERLFVLGPQLYELGREELQKYDYKSQGSYMGYKGYGAAVVDEKGNLDRNEFYNIPKDDFLGISTHPFAHPQILYDHKPLIVSYMKHCHSIVRLILSHLNTHLHLPPGTLESLHRQHAVSGDQVRIVKSPPQPLSDRQIALGKHTDFGSITILFNRLGGLQILPPPSLSVGEPEWTYVRPLARHCIVNLGDAMVKFTSGLLRSNIHRVVSPPGAQATETRYSLVYFARPEDDIVLKRLEGSDVIPPLEEGAEEDAMSSKDWIKLQAMRARKIHADMSEEDRAKLWKETGRGS